VRWRPDNPDSIVDKNAPGIELIAAYRNRGHLMADIDPLRLDKIRFRSHADLNVQTHGLTLWDLDREFKVDGFAGEWATKCCVHAVNAPSLQRTNSPTVGTNQSQSYAGSGTRASQQRSKYPADR
jgi:2-oxoglutarate dehydrogenase complex dehydrogenase (E1) component-like enzyme